MQEIVSRIRELESMFGDGIKSPQINETKAESNLRRSAAANKKLPSGHILKESDLIWVRPGIGISWEQRDMLLGKTLYTKKEYAELIKTEDVY